MKEKLKSNQAITLVALVITIVIIIILATIAMNFAFGENGLITKAQQAAEMTEIARIQEELEMAKGTAAIDGLGEIDPDHYFDIIEDEGIIDDKETDVEDNGDGSYDVTTDGDHIFEVTPTPDGDIEIEYVGKNHEARISKINVVEQTETSVTLEVVTKNVDNAENLEYTYTYKKTNEGEETWQPGGTTSENPFTIEGLEENTSYDIKVSVELEDGTTIEKTITVVLGNGAGAPTIPDNAVNFGEIEWQGDGTANLPVSTDEDFTIEYQVVGADGQPGEWKPVEGGEITGLKPGEKVNVKLTDGENDSNIQTIEIKDEIPPTVKINVTNSTSGSITVSASATDGESGMASSLTYTYYIKQNGTGDESYQAPSGATDISSNTYTFTGLQQGTSYDVKVEVKSDVAGNTGTGTLLNQTTASIPGGSEGVTQGAITFGTPSWNGGQASITVSTNTNYQIEYKLNAPEIDEGWTSIDNKGAISGLGHGSTVYARLTDGTNHGDYATASITDSIKPTVTVTAQGAPTSNSLSVSVSAQDNESGMASSLTYTYYIKQSAEADTTYVAKASNIAANTYIFSGLTQGTSYDIKVEVTGDIAGNTGTGTLLNQTTAKIPDASGEEMQEGAITFSTPSWSSGKASVIVSTNTTYQIEYKFTSPETDDSWTPIANNGTISNIANGTTIYARLTDGANHGEYASVHVEDITVPRTEISLSGTSTNTAGSVTATVTITDSGSGVDITGSKWVYSTNSGNIGTEEASYSNSFTTNPQQLTLSTTTPGTYYLHVLAKDMAGNKVEKISEAITVVQLVTNISVTPSSTSVTAGGTVQLNAVVSPDNANNKNITWSSSNDGVASVNGSGLVTTKTAGNVTITATANDGSGVKGTCNITVNKKLATNVGEVGEAEYVNYVDAKGITRLCAVLWDSTSEYGVEIITMESVEDVYVGDGTGTGIVNDEPSLLTPAMNSYNNAVNTLNSRASSYNNSTYSTRARCVGSNPQNPTLDTTTYHTSTWGNMTMYDGKVKEGDENYLYDYEQMLRLNIYNIGCKFWLASRYCSETPSSLAGSIWCVYDSGGSTLNNESCFDVRTDGRLWTSDTPRGLRPVFKLKDNVKITGGSGTQSDPYTLGV